MRKYKNTKEGEEIFYQKQESTGYLYFILSGKIDLFLQNKLITTRETGKLIGEFPFLNPSLPHTVTAKCHENTVVAKITENQFSEITKNYPILWKNMAEVLADRLYTTTNIHAAPKGSRVFIGHGHSETWRELKDFIQDRLHFVVDEFNREPIAGISTTSRLSDMLDELYGR